MRLKVSGYKMHYVRYGIQDKKNHALCIMYHALFLLVIVSCLFLTSCAAKKIELPDYEGIDIKEIIAGHSSIESVEATFSVEFEKGESVMTGDAALELSDKSFSLRIYSLGFLVAEITEAGGVIKSNPEISSNRKIILIDGLRNSILWWRIQNYEIDDQDKSFQLRNSWQRILVDKKTMLPTYQALELDDAKELKIFYEEPLNSGDFWYPSKMRIEMSRYVVRMQIKTISLYRRPVQDQQQPH